jgi:hypothetical protein
VEIKILESEEQQNATKGDMGVPTDDKSYMFAILKLTSAVESSREITCVVLGLELRLRRWKSKVPRTLTSKDENLCFIFSPLSVYVDQIQLVYLAFAYPPSFCDGAKSRILVSSDAGRSGVHSRFAAKMCA